MSRNLSNINKIFSRSESPNPDELVDYVNQDLNDDKAREIEEAMVDDPFLSDAAEGIESIGTEDFSDLLAELNADIDARVDQPEGKEIPFTPQATPVASPERKRTSGFRIVAIAAAVVLICLVGFFMLPSATNNHYQGIDPSTVVMAGEVQQESEFERAAKLYEEKKFKQAALIFEKNTDAASVLMAGHSYFNLGDYKQAAEYFEAAIDLDNGTKEDAEYNLALCFIEEDKESEAKKLLGLIAGDAYHPFHSQAESVLADLGN